MMMVITCETFAAILKIFTLKSPIVGSAAVLKMKPAKIIVGNLASSHFRCSTCELYVGTLDADFHTDFLTSCI